MRPRLVLALVLLLSRVVGAQEHGAPEEVAFAQHYRGALGAFYERQDWPGALTELRAAATLAPGDVGVQLYLAYTLTSLSRPEEALAALARVVAMEPTFDPRRDERLAPLFALPGFRALVARLPRGALGRARPAFRLPLRDLLPEGIAHDPRTGQTFLSSIRKGGVVAVDRRGRHRWFVAPRQDGSWGTLGLKVDVVRRLLWVASRASPTLEAPRPEPPGAAGVFVYDLDRGTLRRKLGFDASGPHLPNDLALADDGTAFVTDSEAALVYRVPADRDALEPLTAPGRILYPNGIALAADQRTLYVAGEISGLFRLDREGGEPTPVRATPGVYLGGIDGLVRDGDTLVAVQNGLGPGRVIRFRLSPDGRQVLAGEVLVGRHPAFSAPTTGALVGRELWFIANSQIDRITPDGGLPPTATLAEPLVLRVPLR